MIRRTETEIDRRYIMVISKFYDAVIYILNTYLNIL